MRVTVLTLKVAADRLGVSRHEVGKRLADGRLTPAIVDDRPAVLVDDAFRGALRAQRRALKVAA